MGRELGLELAYDSRSSAMNDRLLSGRLLSDVAPNDVPSTHNSP